jgi:hypothetical protein
VAILLSVAAVSKFISSWGHAGILDLSDPVFGIPFRMVFTFVGSIEITVAATCLCSKNLMLRAMSVAWLSTSFMIYRIGLFLLGYRAICPCLGHLTDALHIPPQTADTAMKIILAYLLIGSYATLFWLWRQKRKQSVISPNSQLPTPNS